MGFLYGCKDILKQKYMADVIKKLESDLIKTDNSNRKTVSSYNLAIDILNKNDKDIIYCTSWDRFLIYSGKYFSLVDNDELNSYVLEVLEAQQHRALYNVKPSDIKNAIGFMKMKCTNKVDDLGLNHDYISFIDGLYNTVSHELEPHTNEILCFKYIDISTEDFYKPMPYFDRFLSTTIVKNKPSYPTDYDTVLLYQEMFGLLFCGDRQQNRAFFLKGEGANGKSVTTDLILSFFEEKFTCSANIKNLTEKFGKTQLIGKLVNVCNEEESKHIHNDAFKALITGDKTNDQWKQGSHIDFHNFAKFIFATNSPPTMSEFGYSLQRRVVIIPFNRIFKPSDRDYELSKNLKSEKAQIIGWAMEGLKRLQESRFELSLSDMVKVELERYETESASVLLFLGEFYEVDEENRKLSNYNEMLKAGDFYEEYFEWAKKNGHKTPMSKNKMSKAIARSSIYADYSKERKGQMMFWLKRKLDELPKIFN